MAWFFKRTPPPDDRSREVIRVQEQTLQLADAIRHELQGLAKTLEEQGAEPGGQPERPGRETKEEPRDSEHAATPPTE